MSLEPLNTESRTAIMGYANQFIQGQTKALNVALIKGTKCACHCDGIVKTYMLMELIISSTGDLPDERIDNLYRRLQCIIKLKVTS